jgi:hypothetical protein
MPNPKSVIVQCFSRGPRPTVGITLDNMRVSRRFALWLLYDKLAEQFHSLLALVSMAIIRFVYSHGVLFVMIIETGCLSAYQNNMDEDRGRLRGSTVEEPLQR